MYGPLITDMSTTLSFFVSMQLVPCFLNETHIPACPFLPTYVMMKMPPCHGKKSPGTGILALQRRELWPITPQIPHMFFLFEADVGEG